MNRRILPALVTAAALFSLPSLGNAQMNGSGNGADAGTGMRGSAGQIAQELVRADAALVHKLDASKSQVGGTVEAKLVKTVHLKNGTELPKNTTLEGRVVKDELNEPGQSKVALRFNEAKLPSGQTIPVKAMLVGVYPPHNGGISGDPTMSEESTPNIWNPSIHQIDQINVLPGVDLHSRVAGHNSGVFVSKKKDGVDIPTGDELQFALGPRQQGNQGSGMNSGSGQ
jgi:hypothetical protein